MKIAIRYEGLPPEFAAQLEPAEAAKVADLAGRNDTFTLFWADGQNLMAYAVASPDDDQEFFVVYMARAIRGGLAKVAAMALFGAAQVSGKPIRFHETRLKGLMQMMGAEIALPFTDGDGKAVGVFHGVQ